MKRKVFKCCICHKEVEKDIRLVYQRYDKQPVYGKYVNRRNFDFCNECFKTFQKWIVENKVKR